MSLCGIWTHTVWNSNLKYSISGKVGYIVNVAQKCVCMHLYVLTELFWNLNVKQIYSLFYVLFQKKGKHVKIV